MAKKTKTKAWVKGLIAVAVIAVIGGLGYYGANGEMFQGKSSVKMLRPSAKNVKTVDRVENVRFDRKADKTDRVIQPLTVDGVDEKFIMEVAQPIELDKVSIDGVYTTEKIALTDDVAFTQKDVVYTTEKVDYAVTTDKLAVEQDNVALDAGTLDKIVVPAPDSTLTPIGVTMVAPVLTMPKLELRHLERVDAYSTSLYDTEKDFVDGMYVSIFEIENVGGGVVTLEKLTVAPTVNYIDRDRLASTANRLNVALGVGSELVRVKYDAAGRYAGTDVIAIDLNRDGIFFGSNEFSGLAVTLGANEKMTFALINDLATYSSIAAYEKTGNVVVDLALTQFRGGDNETFSPEKILNSFQTTPMLFN